MKRAAIEGDSVILVFTMANGQESEHIPYSIFHMKYFIWNMEYEICFSFGIVAWALNLVTHGFHGRVRPGFERRVVVGQNHGQVARQFETRREDGFDVAASRDLFR